MTENQRNWAIEEIEINILPDACDEVAEQALKYAIEALKQPERPNGHWICDWFPMMGETNVTCSHCGCSRFVNGCYVGCKGEPLYDEDSFCPDCGADMRGGRNE